MRIRAEVLVAEDAQYTTKASREVKEANVTLLDRCPDHPMRNTFDVRVEGIPASHFNTTLRGKIVSVDVLDIQIWQGRLRMTGKIVDLEKVGAEPKKAA